MKQIKQAVEQSLGGAARKKLPGFVETKKNCAPINFLCQSLCPTTLVVLFFGLTSTLQLRSTVDPTLRLYIYIYIYLPVLSLWAFEVCIVCCFDAEAATATTISPVNVKYVLRYICHRS